MTFTFGWSDVLVKRNVDQRNLIGAGREGSRFFSNLSIFEVEKWFIPLLEA
jgi:hypothetical protein